MAGKNVLNEGNFGHKPSSVMIIYSTNEYFKKLSGQITYGWVHICDVILRYLRRLGHLRGLRHLRHLRRLKL
jgi:hypothetical protein